MPNHSFAIIAFNDSRYLIECLESIKNQTIKSEIFISTSTPSKYIFEIAKKYEVKVLTTHSGLGIAHDWNFGLSQARTKYVTLAHQDDIYESTYTETCIRAIERHEDNLICFTGYTEIITNKERSKTLLLNIKRFILWFVMPIKKNIRSKFLKRCLLSCGCPIAAPSVMYNIENLIGFQFSNEFSINMDWDAWLKMAKMNGRFIYVPEKLLKHRIHPESATTIGLKNNLRQKEDLKIFKRIWPSFFANILSKLYSKSYKSNTPRV